LIAGDASTGEDLLQIALARAYLKWAKISARGEHPLGYVARSKRRPINNGERWSSATLA